MRKARILVGLIVWAVVLGVLWQIPAISTGSAPVGARVLPELRNYWLGQNRQIVLRFADTTEVAVGDPIFVVDASGSMRQVGEVRGLVSGSRTLPERRGETFEACAVLYPTAPPSVLEAKLTYFTTPDSLPWVVSTLLTPQRKQLVTDELRAAIEQHRAEIVASFKPIVETTIRDSWLVAERDLPEVLERHRGELKRLGTRYEREIINRELVPLVQREIWPIVQREAQPTVDRIGIELWERVSLWRFAWRAAYDRSPLPERRLMDEEWKRFVRQEAMPILSKHTDDFIAVIRAVIRESANNDAVRAGVERSMSAVAGDPEFQRLLWDVFAETFVENPRMRQALERNWTGAEAQGAMSLASERLEPTVRRIADILFGTLEEGITPEFAQVLRTQILAKDRRWFLLEVSSEAALGRRDTGPVVLSVMPASGAYQTAALARPGVLP